MKRIALFGALVALNAWAVPWAVNEKAQHPKSAIKQWDGVSTLELKPRDLSGAEKVFAQDIKVGDSFDVKFRLTFANRDGDPCRIAVVFRDREGRGQDVLVRADAVGDLPLKPAVLSGCSQDFLLKVGKGVLTVYHSEPGQSYLRLGKIALSIIPVSLNLQRIPSYHLLLGMFDVTEPKPLPRRTSLGLVAAQSSREQPLTGAETALPGKKTQIPIPLDRHTTMRLAFDKTEDAGTLYVKGRSSAAFPIYVMKATFTPPCDVLPDWKRGQKYEFPHAKISVGGLGQQCVVPMMERYASSRTLFDAGKNLLREWKLIDFDARRHVLSLDFEPVGNGDVRMWVDGSYMTTLAGATNAYLVANGGLRWRLDKRAVSDRRFLPLDLTANPRALSFAEAKLDGIRPGRRVLEGVPFEVASPLDSQDVALAKCAMGSYGLGSNPYRVRSPLDGYTLAVHYRVPPAHYVKAHVLFTLDDAPQKRPTLRFRMARYFKPAAGSNMVEDVPVDLSAGIPADCPRIGTVTRAGKAYPLHRLTVVLPAGRCLDFATHGDYIDFEAVGESDSRQDSAFNLFAVTLERAPFVLDVRQTAPGNVYAENEKGRKTSIAVRSEFQAEAELVWSVTNSVGEVLLQGSRRLASKGAGETSCVDVPLDDLKDWGLYGLTYALRDSNGELLLEHPARVAVVPPTGRLADANITNSPYCAWYFDRGIHGGVKEHETVYALLQKLGVRKVTWSTLSREESSRYQLLNNGAVKFPSPGDFNGKLGKFTPKNGKDGETWVVENLKDQIASRVWVDHIMIWHENAPPSGVPEEVMGWPVPAATDKDRFSAAYFNECGRIARKHFPHLRLKVGNWLGSSGACFRPFRAGANPDYFDCLGMEPYNGGIPPEVFALDTIQAQLLSRETIEHFARRPIPVDAAYEFTTRPLAACQTEENQARYVIRDSLLGLANDYRLIPIASPTDGNDGYHDSEWGGGGYCFRKPYIYPKALCVAVAVLTKMIDAPVAKRFVDTGSKSVYAIEFKRTDGRFVTVFWTTRGLAELMPGVKGETVSMTGRRGSVGGFMGLKTVVASESPLYLLTAKPLDAVRLVGRTFPESAATARTASVVAPLASIAEVDVSPDQEQANRGMPARIAAPGMRVRSVSDPEKGACLEIAVDESANPGSKFFSEYTTLRLKSPAVLPADANGIGLWVKGDSGWGNVRFEVEDGYGKVYKNLQPSTFDPVDPNGRMAIDFDGWAYLSYPIDVPYSTAWTRCSRGLSPTWMKPPVRVRAITVALNRHAPHLNEFKPVSGCVRICGLGGARLDKERNAGK